MQCLNPIKMPLLEGMRTGEDVFVISHSLSYGAPATFIKRNIRFTIATGNTVGFFVILGRLK